MSNQKGDIVSMDICKHCGQLHNKECIFEYTNSIKVLQLFLVSYITLSKFNELSYKFPTKEVYNSFALLNNFLNSEEIEELYKEEYIDILLFVLDNLELDSLTRTLIFGGEEYDEMFIDDSTFIPSERIIKENYMYLRDKFSIDEEYLDSRKSKRIFELYDSVEEMEKITWQVLSSEVQKL